MPVTWHRAGRRRQPVPEPVRAALEPGPGEQLLAWGADERTGTTVVAATHHLYAVSLPDAEGAPSRVVLDRPWHLVDAGLWRAEDGSLTVTWVDGRPADRFVLSAPGALPETVRERVQASVVLAENVDLGNRRSARVVVRQDLGSGRLTAQTLLGRGVRASDPGVRERTSAAMARLQEQVGLD